MPRRRSAKPKSTPIAGQNLDGLFHFTPVQLGIFNEFFTPVNPDIPPSQQPPKREMTKSEEAEFIRAFQAYAEWTVARHMLKEYIEDDIKHDKKVHVSDTPSDSSQRTGADEE